MHIRLIKLYTQNIKAKKRETWTIVYFTISLYTRSNIHVTYSAFLIRMECFAWIPNGWKRMKKYDDDREILSFTAQTWDFLEHGM